MKGRSSRSGQPSSSLLPLPSPLVPLPSFAAVGQVRAMPHWPLQNAARTAAGIVTQRIGRAQFGRGHQLLQRLNERRAGHQRLHRLDVEQRRVVVAVFGIRGRTGQEHKPAQPGASGSIVPHQALTPCPSPKGRGEFSCLAPLPKGEGSFLSGPLLAARGVSASSLAN